MPTFAQSPQLREALAAYDKKEEEAFNNNDAAALAALYWGAIKVREGDTLKTCMRTWNITPAPPAIGAATPSPTTTPSNK